VLVYSEYLDRIADAIAAERQIKGWSRAKKQTLIEGRFDRLCELSRRGSRRTRFACAPHHEGDGWA